MTELDLDLVRHALSVARRHGFAEVEIGVGEDRFSARIDPRVAAQRPVAAATEAEPAEPALVPVKATLVGYYRETRTPLAVGAHIKKGDVVAVIAALGIANDVESNVTGEVVEVLVTPDQPVEYGQALARVRPQEA